MENTTSYNPYSLIVKHGYDGDYVRQDAVVELILSALEDGMKLKTAFLIQTIENRIAELEIEIITPNGFHKTWQVQRQNELKCILTLLQS